MSLFVICFVFYLTPDSITDGLLKVLKPKNTIAARSAALRGGNKPTMYARLMRLKEALKATGKTKSFSASVTLAVVLMFSGAAAAVMLNNIFLLPVFCIAGTALPFLYLGSVISGYEKQLADDLITAVCYSGGFTDEFWECDSVHVDEYMYYDIDYGADEYFDASAETVQLGDSMWVEVSAGIDVKGAGAFKIPITVSVKRFGISERYHK